MQEPNRNQEIHSKGETDIFFHSPVLDQSISAPHALCHMSRSWGQNLGLQTSGP